MKKILLSLLLLLTITFSFSQGIYFYTGKNFTNYAFKKNMQPNAIPFQSGMGSSYEMGYSQPISSGNINYLIGLTLNEYNALAGTPSESYKWNTNYFGIQNSLQYTVRICDYFHLSTTIGLNLASIIYGKQELNGIIYDLKSQKEFTGIIVQPVLGLQAKLKLTDNSALSLGYNFTNSIHPANNSTEQLTFKTSQLVFGIHFDSFKK